MMKGQTASSGIGSVTNFIAYQLVWLASVQGAAHDRAWIGVLLALVAIGTHLVISHSPRTELRIILLTGLIGGGWETFIVLSGWVHYREIAIQGLPPLWIIGLWLAFATTFNASLSWLQTRLGLAALLGLTGGPLAWYAGLRMGALEIPDPAFSLTLIGIGWALILPLLLWLSRPLLAEKEVNHV